MMKDAGKVLSTRAASQVASRRTRGFSLCLDLDKATPPRVFPELTERSRTRAPRSTPTWLASGPGTTPEKTRAASSARRSRRSVSFRRRTSPISFEKTATKRLQSLFRADFVLNPSEILERVAQNRDDDVREPDGRGPPGLPEHKPTAKKSSCVLLKTLLTFRAGAAARGVRGALARRAHGRRTRQTRDLPQCP